MTSHLVPASLAVPRLYFIRNNKAYLNVRLTIYEKYTMDCYSQCYNVVA